MPSEDPSSSRIRTRCPTCGRGYCDAQAEAALDAVSGCLTCNRCGSALDVPGPARLEFEALVRRNQERLRLERADAALRTHADRRAAELRRECEKVVAERERWLQRCDKIVAKREEWLRRRERERAAAEHERRRSEAEREDRARQGLRFAEFLRERAQVSAERERLRDEAARAEDHARRQRRVQQLRREREDAAARVAQEAKLSEESSKRRRNPLLDVFLLTLDVDGAGSVPRRFRRSDIPDLLIGLLIWGFLLTGTTISIIRVLTLPW